MRKFMGLTRRNLLLYFKDVQSVVFSLLTSIIVFVLYLFFLKSSFVDSIEASMQGLEDLIDRADIEMFVNGFLLSGILGSAMITVPYNCLGTIVKDKENKIDYDVSVTPMKRGQIVLSYFTAAAFSAFLMTTLIMLVGVLLLSLQGDLYLGIRELLALLGVTFLGAVSSTA
ncbi:MAG: ABC transporter permease, partial [Lachnospiraceae bacterium]|nr:ABC transporter permease [Lachnospiraceae bacterium]